jgi:hypothetical protein
MSQFIVTPFKPASKDASKKADGLKDQALKKIEEVFKADSGNHAFKVILLRAPAKSIIEFGAHANKPSEEAQKIQKEVEGLEVYECTIFPEVGIISSQMNIPEKPAGK